MSINNQLIDYGNSLVEINYVNTLGFKFLILSGIIFTVCVIWYLIEVKVENKLNLLKTRYDFTDNDDKIINLNTDLSLINTYKKLNFVKKTLENNILVGFTLMCFGLSVLSCIVLYFKEDADLNGMDYDKVLSKLEEINKSEVLNNEIIKVENKEANLYIITYMTENNEIAQKTHEGNVKIVSDNKIEFKSSTFITEDDIKETKIESLNVDEYNDKNNRMKSELILGHEYNKDLLDDGVLELYSK